MTADGTDVEYISSLVKKISNNASAFVGHSLDEAARVNTLHTARQLVAALEKPKEAVWQNAFLPAYNTCVRLAVDLNLFQLLVGGDGSSKTASSLAAACRAEELLVVRILRVLSGIGCVEEDGIETYKPNPITRAMTNPALQACIKHLFDYAGPALSVSVPYFRSNDYKSPTDNHRGPLQYAFKTDLDLFQILASQPEDFATFNTLMEGNRGNRPSWLTWFPIQAHLLGSSEVGEADVLMVDVAGGHGHDISAFRTAVPNAKGRLVLQDLPTVLEEANQQSDILKKNAIETIPLDFLTSQPVPSAQIYFMHFVIHDWPDITALTILRNIGAAMKPGYSTLLLNEVILSNQNCPSHAAGLDIMMMALNSGMERSEKQWRNLLDEAGLEVVKIWPPPGADGEGIIECVLKN